jgi:hypothetical protein
MGYRVRVRVRQDGEWSEKEREGREEGGGGQTFWKRSTVESKH